MEDVLLRTDEPVEAVTACEVVCAICMEAELLRMQGAFCAQSCTACMDEMLKSM